MSQADDDTPVCGFGVYPTGCGRWAGNVRDREAQVPGRIPHPFDQLAVKRTVILSRAGGDKGGWVVRRSVTERRPDFAMDVSLARKERPNSVTVAYEVEVESQLEA